MSTETATLNTVYVPAGERRSHNDFWTLGDLVAVYTQTVDGDNFWFARWRNGEESTEELRIRFLSEIASRLQDANDGVLPYSSGERTVPAFPAPDVDWATAAETETVVLGTRTGEEIITDPLDPRIVHFFVAAAKAADDAGHCEEYDNIAEEAGLPTRKGLRRAGAMPMIRVTAPVVQVITETRTRTLRGIATIELDSARNVTSEARDYIDTTADEDIDVVWDDDDDNGDGWEPVDVDEGNITNDYAYGRYVERITE